MTHPRPGIDIPVATEETILHEDARGLEGYVYQGGHKQGGPG